MFYINSYMQSAEVCNDVPEVRNAISKITLTAIGPGRGTARAGACILRTRQLLPRGPSRSAWDSAAKAAPCSVPVCQPPLRS